MLRRNTETYSCNHRVHFVWGPSFFLFSYFYEVFSRVMKVMKHFFSQCSVSCGKGFKFRDVHCLDSFQAKIEEGNCRHLKKPRTYKICRAGRCPAWKTSSWKEVGKICCLLSMRVQANIFMTPCFNGSIYQEGFFICILQLGLHVTK